jgi:hydroxyacylglutathione hydrolase
MIVEQHYLECLSQASYFIGDETTGRAVVIDPRRDISPYLESAAEHAMSIELVIETHFHADFLSGHLEIAEATGAEIGYGDNAETEFESRKLAHGERISLGQVELEIRHTPGHTPESISIVVFESADSPPHAVFTGDTMFIGDVGRPDLLASVGISREELADHLYESIHGKLLTLPDTTRVYPAHGAGSACGKNLSTETSSTIGEQRETNYALLAPDKPTFVDLVTEGQPPAPAYFAYDADLNRHEHALLDESEAPSALTHDELRNLVADGAMLIDGRDPEDFARGHLAGSINIGLAGRYAEFAGSVVPSDVDIVLVVDVGFETEAKNRLGRIGFDRVVGHLGRPHATMAASPELVQPASRLTARQFDERLGSVDDLQLVDVRNPGELRLGSIDGAISIPVGQLPSRVAELDANVPTVVYCAGGYRSSVAASVLREAGFADVSDIVGGYGAWLDAQPTA